MLWPASIQTPTQSFNFHNKLTVGLRPYMVHLGVQAALPLCPEQPLIWMTLSCSPVSPQYTTSHRFESWPSTYDPGIAFSLKR